MFGFDTKYAMFDITPVENQFILEYLPAAKGDYVRVYLYGLMRCYHPEEDMSLSRMCHELDMTEDQVTAAFRYWERKRLVRRVSDQPPQWQYISIKQILMNSDEEAKDPEYENFCSAIYEAFDNTRRLHGSELNACFEWYEELGLPTEVIILLLNHMVQIKGKNFRFSDAGKTAAHMVHAKIRTVQEAEAFFLRDGHIYKGIREILKKLGKNYAPSEAQVRLYQKWLNEWQFTHEAILEACELTAKGDPSLGYLDGILSSLKQDDGGDGRITADRIRNSSARTDGLRKVLKELGRGEVNRRNLLLYDQMTDLYPQEIICIAARECGHSGKDTGDILKLLQSWNEKGLDSMQDIQAYVQSFHDQTALIRELRSIWGAEETRIGKSDRSLVSKWENEFGLDTQLILFAAAYATAATQPMTYLDKILTGYYKKGVRTPEEARREHDENSKPAGKMRNNRILPAQDFSQRDYTDVPDEMMGELAKEMEAVRSGNGGESDA